MAHKSFITGCQGLVLSTEEAAFIGAERPWGFILFARNLEDGAQIKRLCGDLRAAADDEFAPIFIDQEGGRVRRLKPPLVPDYPPGSVYGALFSRNSADGVRAAWIAGRLMAHDLTALGITGNCVPIVDVRQPYTDAIIGDRAYSDNPGDVSALGRAMAEGTMAGGVLPVMKHVPGHGRAELDSHVALPIVEDNLETLQKVDFRPFADLSDLPLAMTAHIVYSVLDNDQPATTSKLVIDQIVRKQIGFDGLLMTDDLSMRALRGTIGERTKAALQAGCDIALHCNGEMPEMRAVANCSVELSGESGRRADRARSVHHSGDACDTQSLREEFDGLLSGLAAD